ncbi:MAG: squalene/phytoene synthase family protein, partial [Alphaproteobacteria bacterium]|nr:squalene/phytoene synthase family protein [Alphaproteobacteria bacterium]
MRSADRDLYWVCLLLPAAARNGGFVLATLHAELAAIPTRARDPMAALVRWRWWQDGIERICGHDPVAGPYAAHLADSPILQALHTLYADDALDRDVLIGLVEAHEPR